MTAPAGEWLSRKVAPSNPMSPNVVPLFRPESLKARQVAWLGRPALALGLPTRAITVAVVLLAAAATSLIAFGSYARRVDLRGVVVPQSGLVKISAPTGGWIQSINVADGEEVAEGAILTRSTSTPRPATATRNRPSSAHLPAFGQDSTKRSSARNASEMMRTGCCVINLKI
jgi:hypothetical protein